MKQQVVDSISITFDIPINVQKQHIEPEELIGLKKTKDLDIIMVLSEVK